MTEKPTAAPRSAIRRHRTLRGPHARPHAVETRRRRILSMVADTTPEEYEVWEMQRASPPNDGELTSGAYIQERAHRIFEAGQTRLRDTLSFERQNPRATNSEMDGPLMPPVPESRDYSAIEDHQQRMRHISRRLAARRNLAPTPPYTETDLASLPRIGSDYPRPSTLTPALSPSRQSSSYDTDPVSGRPLDSDTAVIISARRPYRTSLSDVSTLNPHLSQAIYFSLFINLTLNTRARG